MSDDLDLKTIFDIVSGWSVEEIQSIMYHKKWTRQGSVPFEETDKSGNQPAFAPKIFENCRASLKVLLESDFSILNEEETAMIVICSTFLLMNDLAYVRKDNLEKIIHTDKVKQNMLRLLNDMDDEVDGSIKKLQLFYALHKQRENPDKKIKKITWSGVTSSWGPKIVMSDDNFYYFIFNDFTEFDEYREKYNIAAKLGEAEQYRSEYVDEGEDFNLRIIGVIGTRKCRTLAEFFTAKELGRDGKFSESKLPERLSEEFFRNELDASMDVLSDELMAVLPRLTSGDVDPCVDSILKKTDEWNIPRLKITYKNDEGETQTYFVVHGDEWGGNFLVAEDARQVYVIDYEDAIYSNSNNQGEVQQVGGDLSSRIFNPEKMKKTEDSLEDQGAGFSPIGLSVFASIGRLMAALVQYHSRWKELEKDSIPSIVNTYLKSFEKSFGEKESILKNDHWESNYQPLILLHAWDWAIYWKKKRRFPTKHYDKFIDEIKKLLCGEDAQTDEQKPITYPSRPDTGPGAMPSDNTEARKEREIRDEIIEKIDDDAWNSYSEGDLAKAEANWGIALQMLNEMKSNEDKGYFSYFKTKVAYLRNDDVEQAVDSLLQCIRFCQDDNDDAYLMEALLFLAYLRRISGTRTQAMGVLNQLVYLYNTGDFEESPEPFDNEQLMEWPESEGDYKHTVLCNIKRMVANFFWKFGEYDEASKLYENLMQYFEGTQQHDRSDNARVNLGILKSKLGEYEESDDLQNQCLEYRRKEYAKVNDGDTGEITKALRNLGQNAMAWRKFEKAKQYFTKCIAELRNVPSEVVHRDDIGKYIGFNERCVMVCDINIQIMSVQNHYLKRQDKIKRLRAISEESDLHLEVCLPSLMRLVDRGDRCYTKENLSAFLKFSNHNIMIIANLLIDRFEEYEYARELLLSIHSNDLDYLTTMHLCQMLEKIYYFYDDASKENLANYHAELEDEFSIAYPSFLDPSQEVVEKVEMRNSPFWQLDKYMTRLLIDLGVVDFHIHEGLHDSTFREILTDLFHGHDSKSILRLIQMGLAGQLWPYEEYTSGSDLLKARDTYSSDVMENVDVMWENAQSTLDDVTEFLAVIVGAMSNIKVASIASNSKMKYYKDRFSDAIKVMEAWFSKEDAVKTIYNDLCKFVTRTNSVPKELQFLCNIIDDISDIDVPAMQQRLFAIYAIIWSKSNARYTISLKKPGFRNHKDSVIKLAERLCIWIKQQPQKFELIASFSSDSKSLEGDPRIFLAKQLVKLYKLRIPQEWPFDVLNE